MIDPTCGSGSLLLKVAYEAQSEVSIYGQEKDITTVGLALMNMYLHNCPLAEIKQGNTIAKPQFTKNNDTALETFDYVVANPPFSIKSWSTGITPSEDVYGRFELGTPPEKNGDYAFLLHILKSMKQTGHGAVILPHGVLFRGNAEEIIRRNIVDKRWIKGIISLPANLFFGTGIPACIIVLDKSEAESRKLINKYDVYQVLMEYWNETMQDDLYITSERETNGIYSLEDISDGFKQFLSIVFGVNIKENYNNIIAIDEPEVHLHPSAAMYLKEKLLELGKGNYVFYSTHSPFMLDANVSERHYKVSKEDGITSIIKLEPNTNMNDDELTEELFGINTLSLKQNNLQKK